MNNTKFNLSDLKVKSFVTALPDTKEETVKGGRPIQSLSIGRECTQLNNCVQNNTRGLFCN